MNNRITSPSMNRSYGGREHGTSPRKTAKPRRISMKTAMPARLSKVRIFMIIPFLVVLLLIDQSAFSENPNTGDHKNQGSSPQWFIGTSLHSLYDFFPNSPESLQLDFGYRLTQSDVLLLEAITWKYSAPTGIFEGSGAGPALISVRHFDGIDTEIP
jgi:hypothetical protein